MFRNVYLKYLLIIMGAVLLVNLLSWGLAEKLLLADLRLFEQDQARQEFDRLRAGFEREGEFLALWATTRAVHISEGGGVEANFADNLSPQMLEAANLDLAAVTFEQDGQHKTLYAAAGTVAQKWQGDDQLSSTIEALLAGVTSSERRSGLVNVDGFTALGAAVPLDDAIPAKGSVLVLRLMNGARLDYLAELMQLSFRFLNWEPSNGTVRVGDEIGVPSVFVANRSEVKVAGALPALVRGERLHVELNLPRGHYVESLQTVYYYQLWLALLSLSAGLLLLPVLIRLRSRKAREHLLSRMVHESSEAMFLTRPNGQVVLSNPKAEQLIGVKPGTLNAQRLDDLLGASGDKSNWHRLLQQAKEGNNTAVVLKFTCRQGWLVVGEFVCARLDFQGEEHLLLQVRDISQRFAAEEALHLVHERYRLLFENAPLPMWMVDLQTNKIIDVNQTAILQYGYSREEFLEMSFSDLRLRDDAQRLYDPSASAAQLQEGAGLGRHRLKDGRLIDVEVALSDLSYLDREVRLVTALDVSEQQQLRQDAERFSRLVALGELAAGVAHEINNPTGMILRNLDFFGAVLEDALPLLAGRAEDDELQLGGLDYSQVCALAPQLVSDMQRGAGHIRDIVREMKDFSVFEEQPSMEPFDLTDVVAAAVRLLEGPLRKATDVFDVEIAEDLPECKGNHRQVEQVIINLLMNACQSLPDRACGILLRTRFDPVKRCNLVEVIDQGRGIAKADLARLTDPFFTTRRDLGGTGLGLSVSSRIVKQHGGTLDYKSEPGQGTHVTLSLPVA